MRTALLAGLGAGVGLGVIGLAYVVGWTAAIARRRRLQRSWWQQDSKTR